MIELFSSGQVVDLIIGVMIVEFALLIALRQRYGRMPAILDSAVCLLPGLLLLLALRAALLHQSWPTIAFYLVLAFAAHLFDLRRRWVTLNQGQ